MDSLVCQGQVIILIRHYNYLLDCVSFVKIHEIFFCFSDFIDFRVILNDVHSNGDCVSAAG